MATHRPFTLTIALLALLLASACGSSEPVASKATGDMDPCGLLSSTQVADALPQAKAGMISASGGSLLEGVDAYQCTYVNDAGNMLTVILNVARDAERFAEIRPGDAVWENRERVDVGERGWMSVESGEVKVKFTQGYSVIDIELLATDAADRSSQMISLAQIVAAKLK